MNVQSALTAIEQATETGALSADLRTLRDESGLAHLVYHTVHVPGLDPNPLLLLTYEDAWVRRYVALPGAIHGVGSWDRGNVEYVSFAESDAAAVSTSISTDEAAASASAVSAHASTISFAIDFSTGSIQMTRSDAYVAATAQTSSSAASVSVIA